LTNQNWRLLGGAALGASAMYLLNSSTGERRPRGLAAETRSRRRSVADARKLQDRVRAELGRVVSHPRAIDVYVSAHGCVCLTGPVLMEEADAAISAIQAVRGVVELDDRLERYADAEHVPSLQGERVRPASAQRSWSPAAKALVCLGSTALAVGLGYAVQTGSGDPHAVRAT